MLEDQVLVDEVIRMIREQKVNADFAFHTVAERYVTALVAANDEYLRERANDMRDLIAGAGQSARGQGRIRPAPPRRTLHSGQSRSEPVHHSATGQKIRAGVRHRHRRQDFAHGHHGAVAGHSGGGRPANRQRGTGKRRLRVAGRLQRHDHRQSHRPDAVRIRPVGQNQGVAGRKTPGNPATTRRHPRWQIHPPLREHRGPA